MQINPLNQLNLVGYVNILYKWLGIKNNFLLISIFNIFSSAAIGSLYRLWYSENFKTILYSYINNVFGVFWKYNSLKLTGSIVQRNKWDSFSSFTDSGKAVLHYISKLNMKNNNIYALKEIIHKDNDEYCYDSDDENDNCINNTNEEKTDISDSQLIVNQDWSFNLKDSIRCTISSNVTELEGRNTQPEGEKITYTIEVYSYHKTMENLIIFIKKCKKEYFEYLKEKSASKYFYTVKSIKDEKIIWNKFIFKSNRTFENMYIANKGDILNRINFFMNNKQYYIDKGIPYTLGLMFYGEPGTGKTSFIKALANSLNRHIVEIPLKKITSCENLYEAFYTETLTNLNFNNKIIVLEDIDAMDDIIKKRVNKVKHNRKDFEKKSNNDKKNKEGKSDPKVDLNDLFSTLVKGSESQKSVKDISLSFLLNLMEGILEMDGRILVMTTNHIDKIDPALIRPGRIDQKIKFTLLESEHINEMIKFYVPDWVNVDLKHDLKISHAQLMNIIINANDDIAKIKNTLQL